MPGSAPFNCALDWFPRNMNSSCCLYTLFILLHRCFRSCWEESMLTSGKSLQSLFYNYLLY
ncbi:hypothetical protein CPB83DRAFT_860039 [Crepidotus variabilis]|uniref:Uncharacterized protein n=1 Tax=Crepidotus variabilis TaxID=179855 RepID=A0A9P6EA51_9AGAR|nr:hypothetical protein CPB83DRAFT_860039 [Crepidotus variabilis]